METLTQIWERLKEQGYESDKGSVHSYLHVYEKLLEPYRETALNVLEIGIFKGDSLRMWFEYFTKANIYGIDESLTPVDGMADLKPLIEEIVNSEPYSRLFNTHIHIFDAENEEEINKRFRNIKFDVIIEDANHSIEQQINLYNIWGHYLTDIGIYIIEDIQDIELNANTFDGIGGRIFDLRDVKLRYDDVVIVFKNQ